MIQDKTTLKLSFPVFICSVFLVLYFLTASPGIGWRDGPEFVVTTTNLGIPHPAGFPTYSLLTKIMTFLPLGSIPFRITLSMALFAVGALWLLHSLVQRWSWSDVSSEKAEYLIKWVAAGTTIAFGLTSTLWGNTTENEVYTLHLLFIALILYCTLRWSSGDEVKWLYSGVFLYGLAAGNHGSIAFYAPAFLAYFFIKAKADRWRMLPLVIFFFLVGFSVYLYLPIRSLANPPIDLGNPETWNSFLTHVTDRKDSASHFSQVKEGSRFLSHAWIFLRVAVPWWFWPFILPLFILGLWRITKEDVVVAALLIYIIAFDILFFLGWTVLSNFLPAYFLVAYIAGIGAVWCLLTFHKTVKVQLNHAIVFHLIFVCILTVGASIGYLAHNRSRIYLSYEIFREDFETLPPDSIVLATGLWPYYEAFQNVFRMREDLTVMLQSDFLQPDIFQPINSTRFPHIEVPLTKDETGRETAIFSDFLNANFANGLDVYWEPSTYDKSLSNYLIPGPTFLMRLTREANDGLNNELVQEVFDQIHEGLSTQIESRYFFKEIWLGPYYLRYFNFLADNLRQYGRYSDAINVYKTMIDLLGPKGMATLSDNDQVVVLNEWSRTLNDSGQVGEAVKVLERSISIQPNNFGTLYNMGIYLYHQGKIGIAREFFQRSRESQETDLNLYMLGVVSESLNQRDEAIQYFQLVNNKTENKELQKIIDEKLKLLQTESINDVNE